jgi:hypothetical protein
MIQDLPLSESQDIAHLSDREGPGLKKGHDAFPNRHDALQLLQQHRRGKTDPAGEAEETTSMGPGRPRPLAVPERAGFGRGQR